MRYRLKWVSINVLKRMDKKYKKKDTVQGGRSGGKE
jgi:hypothetical protein